MRPTATAARCVSHAGAQSHDHHCREQVRAHEQGELLDPQDVTPAQTANVPTCGSGWSNATRTPAIRMGATSDTTV